jgi:hypothetical protein
MRVLIRSFSIAAILGVMFATAPSVGPARAQNGTIPDASQMGSPATSAPGLPRRTDGSQTDRNPLSEEQNANRMRAVQNERQKRIVDDTAKLLQLANELKTDVDKSTKDELSLDVVRKADEIERLAHEVKLRMKG